MKMMTDLGPLQIVDELLWYDGPQLFTAKLEDGQLFIVMFADTDDAHNYWLCAPIEDDKAKAFSDGEIELRPLIAQAPAGWVYKLTSGPEIHVATSEKLNCVDIPEDLLPREGVRLKRPDESTMNLDFDPDWVVPPGETLREIIEDQGGTIPAMADKMGCDEETVIGILEARTPITSDLAERLEKATGVSASFWERLEAFYQEGLAKGKKVAE